MREIKRESGEKICIELDFHKPVKTLYNIARCILSSFMRNVHTILFVVAANCAAFAAVADFVVAFVVVHFIFVLFERLSVAAAAPLPPAEVAVAVNVQGNIQ